MGVKSHYFMDDVNRFMEVRPAVILFCLCTNNLEAFDAGPRTGWDCLFLGFLTRDVQGEYDIEELCGF